MTLQLNPFIMLNGNAQEAIRFYETSLNAAVLFKQTFGEAPEPSIPAEARERVAHSVLKIGESVVFVADHYPDQSLPQGNRITLCITTNDSGTSEQLYQALLQDGHADMPLQETYFSPSYGIVTDKFGVTFQIFTKRQP